MYISKVRLRSDAQERRKYWSLIQNSYQIHSLVWDLFGDDPEQKRDFLFRTEEGSSLPEFLVISEREPVNRYDVWDIMTKEYHPRLMKGQRLSFVLRANPVVKKKNENGKQCRHDVVMDYKVRLRNEKEENLSASLVEIVQHAGFLWLSSRAEEHGFSVAEREVVADGYRQHSFRKSKGSHAVRFSTIEFSGILEVVDVDRFLTTLYHGIGPEKGFGCGMMLVKSADFL